MKFEEVNGSLFLFGATTSQNWAGNTEGQRTLVFLAEVSSSGGNRGDLLGSSNYWVRELTTSDFGVQSEVIGLRPNMEYDNGSGDYYLHLIFA